MVHMYVFAFSMHVRWNIILNSDCRTMCGVLLSVRLCVWVLVCTWHMHIINRVTGHERVYVMFFHARRDSRDSTACLPLLDLCCRSTCTQERMWAALLICRWDFCHKNDRTVQCDEKVSSGWKEWGVEGVWGLNRSAKNMKPCWKADVKVWSRTDYKYSDVL